MCLICPPPPCFCLWFPAELWKCLPSQWLACPAAPQLLCPATSTLGSPCWDWGLGMCFTLGCVLFSPALFIAYSFFSSSLFIHAFSSRPPTVRISKGSGLVKGRAFLYIYFLAAVVLSLVKSLFFGTVVTSMLWSHSNKLLDILVPLFQMIGMVCSLMSIVLQSTPARNFLHLSASSLFFMFVYILSPACKRRWLSFPHQF